MQPYFFLFFYLAVLVIIFILYLNPVCLVIISGVQVSLLFQVGVQYWLFEGWAWTSAVTSSGGGLWPCIVCFVWILRVVLISKAVTVHTGVWGRSVHGKRQGRKCKCVNLKTNRSVRAAVGLASHAAAMHALGFLLCYH